MGHNHNDGHKPEVQVLIQPNIGLDSDVRCSVVELLNTILADEAVLTAKTRSAHWNVRGAEFFELHTLFETQYQLLNNLSNEIAERTRMLGGVAIGTLQEFLDQTRLEEHPGEVPDILRLLADHELVIRTLREATKKSSDEFEDDGSYELFISVMRLHEKMAWMLRSYLETDPNSDNNQTRI